MQFFLKTQTAIEAPLVSASRASGVRSRLDVVFTAWALYGVIIQHTGSPVFVHIRACPLDWVLARAIATSGHLPIECDTSIIIEHGRRSCDDLATRGGRIAVADRCFTQVGKSKSRLSTKLRPCRFACHTTRRDFDNQLQHNDAHHHP